MLINTTVFIAGDNVSIKVFINVLVFYLLNICVLYLLKKISNYDRAVFLFGMDTVKFILLVAILLFFTNPLQTQNHTPALLYCGNYFIFQSALIFSVAKM